MSISQKYLIVQRNVIFKNVKKFKVLCINRIYVTDKTHKNVDLSDVQWKKSLNSVIKFP